MGLYIKGMKIPKEGRITIQIGADGAVYTVTSCKITAEAYEKKCSAIEVTEPCGRLVDADAPISLVDTRGQKFEVTVAHIIEKNLGAVKAIIPASKEK